MLDCRRPRRTKTESPAQPIAEKIATTSANMLSFSLHRDGSHQISVGLDHFQGSRMLKKPHRPIALSIVEGCAQSPRVNVIKIRMWNNGMMHSKSDIPMLSAC